ncbi:HupE/UreJ family protein [Adhaeribacter aquaticus]|uniref:HupE/UreJ family protein n=1 Tax=Adhaeribacter aquaticus TaxID=299567 RepID=UPI00041F901B|nr:HupE/UreJ family protein [Adhaeribacter aquaticus]
MNDFSLYFGLGLEHILDLQGYDHILFVSVLCGIYLFSDWQKILVLVTAFTIGHSITLILSVFEKIQVSVGWIEFLIPVTIMFTAISNLISVNKVASIKVRNYGLTLLFGLIHGLGFSFYLKSLLGRNANILLELLAFNVGLEVGQILIVIFVLLFSYLVVNRLKVSQRNWNILLSSLILVVSLYMAIERLRELL